MVNCRLVVMGEKQSCCVAVLPNLRLAVLAFLELYFDNSRDFAVSILNKPAGISGNGDYLRVKSIGAITCRGRIGQTLKQQSVINGNGMWKISELLNLFGIPARHVGIYDQALKSGFVVFILQGKTQRLRKSRYIFEKNSLQKPVLYLV